MGNTGDDVSELGLIRTDEHTVWHLQRSNVRHYVFVSERTAFEHMPLDAIFISQMEFHKYARFMTSQ